MSTATKTKKAKKATTAKKAAKSKKPSMENTGTGKNNPTAEKSKKPSMENTGTGQNNATEQKDTDMEQYQDIDNGKETDIHQTIDESDNVGKDIDYK